jgi:DNA-binding CsgD family transcriptional regulator
MERRMVKVITRDVPDRIETAIAPVLATFGDKYGLTPREREVLRLLLLFGLRNEDISGILFISTKTTKHHLASMMHKTFTRSSRELHALFLRDVLENLATGLNG